MVLPRAAVSRRMVATCTLHGERRPGWKSQSPPQRGAHTQKEKHKHAHTNACSVTYTSSDHDTCELRHRGAKPKTSTDFGGLRNLSEGLFDDSVRSLWDAQHTQTGRVPRRRQPNAATASAGSGESHPCATRLCWCAGGFSCSSPSHFTYGVGAFFLLGPHPPQQHRTCVSGQTCSVVGFSGFYGTVADPRNVQQERGRLMRVSPSVCVEVAWFRIGLQAGGRSEGSLPLRDNPDIAAG